MTGSETAARSIGTCGRCGGEIYLGLPHQCGTALRTPPHQPSRVPGGFPVDVPIRPTSNGTDIPR